MIASVSVPLAENEISIYVLSAFGTDYFLVPADKFEKAVLVLKDFGHEFPELKEML